ncbi:hypothetical protein BDR26DRAFT_856212 [Obelidium mucronatum]|nr:hypothetical protein BDR26DRAFT_856212 [Obelidium mucronatum]
MTQDEVNAQFPRLRIIASESARQFALGISNIKLISEINVKTLVIIARSRSVGVTQFELSKLINMDPRNLFHQIKVLISLKLIVKAPVTIRGAHSNLCLHKRFARQNTHYSTFLNSQKVNHAEEVDQIDEAMIKEQIQLIMEQRKVEQSNPKSQYGTGYFQCELVRHRVTVLLAGTANRVMVAQDVMDILIGPKIEKMERKMFNKVLGSLQEKGFIEIFETGIPRANGGDLSYTRCLRLLRLYNTSYKNRASEVKSIYYSSAEYQEKVQSEPEKHLVIGDGAVCVDLPVEYQVYNVICLAGLEGTTAAVIRRSLSNLAVRILERILKRMQKPLAPNADPLIMGEIEFQGRERRYRYYSTENYYSIKGDGSGSSGTFTTLMASAVDALAPGTVRKSVSITPSSAKSISRSVTRPSSKAISSRKRKAGDETEEEEGGLDSEADEDVVDPTVNVDSPRTLRTRTKPISFVIPDIEETDIGESEAEHIQCVKCKIDKDDDKILLCDHCDDGVHTYCANPPLEVVPEDDWFCSEGCKSKGKKLVPELAAATTDQVSPTKSKRPRLKLGSDDEESDFELNESSSEDDPLDEEDDIAPPEAPALAGGSLESYGGGSFYENSVLGESAESSGALNFTGSAGAFGWDNPDITANSIPTADLGSEILNGSPFVNSSVDPNSPGRIVNQILTGFASDTALSGGILYPPPVATPTPRASIESSATHALNAPSPMPALTSARRKLALPSSSQLSTRSSTPRQVSFHDTVGPSSSSATASSPIPMEVDEGMSTPTGLTRSRALRTDQKVSVNAKKRQRILLELLEKKSVVEVNMHLADIVCDLLNADNAGARFSIDKKTLSRDCELMERTGLLKTAVVQVPKLNGKAVVKHLMIHPSLSTTGPEVSQYVTNLSEMTMNINPPKGVPLVRETLESLERLGDLQKKFPNGLNFDEYLNPQGLEADVGLDDASNNSETQEAAQLELVSKADPFRFWLNFAKKYGYMMAKVIRVKTLHEWLFGYFVVGYVPGRTREKGVFTTLDVYNYLSLDVYLKAVGVTHESAELNEYLSNGGDTECSLKDLPEALKLNILSKTYKLKAAILSYLDYLMALHIVSFKEEPAENADPTILVNEELVLNETVPIHDYRKSVATFVKNCVIQSQENLRQYWLQIEYLYRKILPDQDEQPLHLANSNQEEGGPPAPKKKKLLKHKIHANTPTSVAKLLTLLQPRNWQSSYLFSSEEVAVLETHIDRGRGVFPTDDNLKIQEVGRQLGIAPAHVKYYFYRVQQNYERRLLIMRDKMLAEQAKRAESEKDGAVLEKNRRKVQEVLKRNKGSQKQSIPPVNAKGEKSAATTDAADPSAPKKRNRTIWSSEDEFLLMHAYAIVRYLSTSREIRFSWVPIAGVFGIERELCRRRMTILLKTKINVEKINFLVAEWPNYYENGVRNGLFEAIPIAELLTLDLKAHIQSYCANSIALESEDASSLLVLPAPVVFIPLPSTLEQVEDSFNVYPFHGAPSKGHTIRSKMSVLYSRAILSDIGNQALLDSSSKNPAYAELDMNIIKAMSCVKSVMCTPETKYSSNLAFRLLYQFTTPVVHEGLEKLLEEGAIVKNRHGYRDRTVPGKSMTLSDKFLTTISGALPSGLIPQILAANTRLFENTSDLRMLPELDNGLVCVLLGSLSQGAIKLTPQLSDDTNNIQSLLSFSHVPPKLELPEFETNFDSFDALTGDIDVLVASAMSSLQGSLGDVARLVNIVVVAAGVNGISLLEAKAKISLLNNQVTDADIFAAISCLLKLRLDSYDIFVISKVGKSHPVFVAANFMANWLVRAVAEEEAPITSTKSFPLRLWYDISGDLIPSAFRACIECVLSHIVESPGVTESSLASAVSPVMNAIELSDILDILLERKACRKVCVLKPKAFTGLRDAMARGSSQPIPCAIDTINENKVTCYFPLPQWYNASNIAISNI